MCQRGSLLFQSGAHLLLCPNYRLSYLLLWALIALVICLEIFPFISLSFCVHGERKHVLCLIFFFKKKKKERLIIFNLSLALPLMWHSLSLLLVFPHLFSFSRSFLPLHVGVPLGAVDCLDPTCSNNGICVNGECHCKPGWGGLHCELPRAQCPDQCHGHGAFIPDTGLCSCDPNWMGPDCSMGECDCGAASAERVKHREERRSAEKPSFPTYWSPEIHG